MRADSELPSCRVHTVLDFHDALKITYLTYRTSTPILYPTTLSSVQCPVSSVQCLGEILWLHTFTRALLRIDLSPPGIGHTLTPSIIQS